MVRDMEGNIIKNQYTCRFITAETNTGKDCNLLFSLNYPTIMQKEYFQLPRNTFLSVEQ